jgi:hypothetical protein
VFLILETADVYFFIFSLGTLGAVGAFAADAGEVIRPVQTLAQETHIPADVSMFINGPADYLHLIGVKKGPGVFKKMFL